MRDRDVFGGGEEELELHGGVVEEVPGFERADEVHHVGGREDVALRGEDVVAGDEVGEEGPGGGEVGHPWGELVGRDAGDALAVVGGLAEGEDEEADAAFRAGAEALGHGGAVVGVPDVGVDHGVPAVDSVEESVDVGCHV